MKLLWHKEEKASLGNYSREPCKLSKIRLGIFINRQAELFLQATLQQRLPLKSNDVDLFEKAARKNRKKHLNIRKPVS